MKKIGQLNLIVGKNNSGKSSVLEALRIYAGNANPYLMIEIAAEHDEKYSISSKDTNKEQRIRPFESFFTGRCFPSNENALTIGELGKS